MPSTYNVLVVALRVLFIVATGMYASEATPSSPFLRLSPASPPPPSHNKTLTFYLQKILADGTNAAVANTVPVAGIQGKHFGFQQFGTFYVYVVNMTASPSRNSTLIGQEYGTFAVADLKGYVFMVSSTYVFTSGELAGSMLTGLGVFDMMQPVSYIPIVGGTSALANAIGYIAYQIVVLEPPYMVIKVTANYKITA